MTRSEALVNVLLWGGAVLAIAGLWWPNWIEALVGQQSPFLDLALFRTPVISYLGYIILWIACIMVVGLKGAASDYGAPGWVGLASVAIAIISSVMAHLGASPSIILLLFTIAAFLASLFIYWTMEKMVEIKRMAKRTVYGVNLIALVLGISAVVAMSSSIGVALTYATAAVYMLTWLLIAVSVLPSHYRYMMEKRKRTLGSS